MPLWLDRTAAISWRFLVVVAAVAVVIAVLVRLQVVVLPLFFGVLFATILRPISDRLMDHRVPPALATLAAMLLLVAVLLGAGFLVVRSVSSEWDDISTSVEEGIDELEARLTDWVGEDQVEELRTRLAEARERSGDTFVRRASDAVSVAGEIVTVLTLSLVVTFFFLKDGRRIWSWIVETLGGGNAPLLDEIGRESLDVTGRYVRGLTVIALVDATFIAVGAALLGLPFAGAIFVVTFFASYIPYVGAVAAGALATVLGLADGGLETGLAMLAVVIVVQQLEANVLEPVVMGRAVRVHPLVAALALVAGGAISGILGMFLAVPITALVVTVVAGLRRAGWFAPDAGGGQDAAVASG